MIAVHHAMAPRVGEPGQELVLATLDGEVRITADERGLFWPETFEQVALLDGHRLPVASEDPAAPAQAPTPPVRRSRRTPTTDAGPGAGQED